MAAQIIETKELSIQVVGTDRTGDSVVYTFKIPNPKNNISKEVVEETIGDVLKTKVFASGLSSDTTEFTSILSYQEVALSNVGTVKKTIKQETVWKE